MAVPLVDLIPRSALFGLPERGNCQVSPCGRWLAFAAPVDGVLNIWVGEYDDDPATTLANARPVTSDRRQGIYSWFWAYDGVHLLYLQDNDGDENPHLFAVPAAGGEARDLTPFAGARAGMQGLSRSDRGAALITLNTRDPRFADVYRLELATGALELVCENPGFYGFLTNDGYRPVLAMAPRADGGIDLLAWAEGEGQPGWAVWQSIPTEDITTTRPALVSRDGRIVHMLDSRGRDTAALMRFDLGARDVTGTLVAEDTRADIGSVWADPITHDPVAWTVTVARREVHPIGDAIRADIAFLDAAGLGDWRIASRTEDDSIWVVAAFSDIAPSTYYLYSRDGQRLTRLYATRPDLTDAPLAPMEAITIPTRDGWDMVAYFTLPPGAQAPAPLVLLVHGGPIERDDWGFNPYHQWLANRGYGVLSVNFRGSSGFGKRFIAAGFGEWGGRMDDDLVDAVRWAIARGFADADRVCIMGASYGGYATLWAMTEHPNLYACGVDIVGPSNLATLEASIPPYWEAARALFQRQIGDPATEEGRALLQARSPVHRAERIARPLLIGHGANDPRVKLAESEQMVAAMKANGVPVTFVLFPDEGHGFGRPANAICFNEITERFLAAHLGGRAEPLRPGEVDGNSAVFVEGVI